MRWNVVVPGLAIALLASAGSLARADEPDAAALDQSMLEKAHVAADGLGLLEFLRKRTLSNTDLERIGQLITELGDDSFEVRQKASAQLVAIGSAAVPLLKQATKSDDIEVVRRAQECLKHIESGSSTAVVGAAARMLAVRKPAGAAEVLLAYLPVVEDELVGEAVRQALTAIAVRDGKADPALVAALADKTPVRRAAAGAALCRAKADDQKPAVRKLLEDKDPQVRLQVGLALAQAKDKDAIPVLIALLDVLPFDQTATFEDALYLLAGKNAPDVAPGSIAGSRRACREKWQEWWQKYGAEVDLDTLAKPDRPLGFTMVILLDEGKLQELDGSKRVRWQMEGLGFPLDAQYLPGDRARVLVAEQAANRVTERDLKGNVVWEKQIPEPLMAQRLPNGATLIASRQHVVEVNRDGTTLATHTRPPGESVMRAQRLPTGDLVIVTMDLNTNASRYVRLDAKGKEVANFPVQVRTSGGRIDVLPDGHVLVPEMQANRVAEYDTEGKVVWSAQVPQPIAAIRLPNGRTLVTSMTENRALEVDRAGTHVWDFRHDSRVSRAWRR
jgi:hypothetical protein